MRHGASAFLGAAFLALVAAPVAGQEEAEEPAAQMADLEVTEAVVATGVEDREPTGADSTFSADVGTVYFYTVFEGDGQGDFTHVWSHEGEELARVPLTANGPRWRTWSSKEIAPDRTGSWTVTVIGPADEELTSVDFTIEEPMGR